MGRRLCAGATGRVAVIPAGRNRLNGYERRQPRASRASIPPIAGNALSVWSDSSSCSGIEGSGLTPLAPVNRSARTAGMDASARIFQSMIGARYVKFKRRNTEALGDLICGNLGVDDPGIGQEPKYFIYRSSMYITEFFRDLDTEWVHDGSTRNRWVADVLDAMLQEPHDGPSHPPEIFCRLIDQLMSPQDALNEGSSRENALKQLNSVLSREGFEAFYADDGHCYLRHLGTSTVTVLQVNPHRRLTAAESKRRDSLSGYLNSCSEDELIEDVLVPLFRQLGFHRITASGHRDKALEYGKDLWMRFSLPTQNYLYFGIQAKKGKIDSAGMSRGGNHNVAEIHHQALMMVAHEVFDPEINKRVLVDYVFIVSGGEITKAARNWLGNALDAQRRSQVMFLDRDDLLNLFVVTSLPLPGAAVAELQDPWSTLSDGEPPF